MAGRARALRVWRGESLRRSSEEIDEVLAPWEAMGLARTALGQAAGLGYRDRAGRVHASTFEAFAAITEDDISDGASVYADLTRQRIGSLMAAGHRLSDMPVSSCGTWRTHPTLRVATVRAIRAYYRLHEFQVGDSQCTATKARNAGHQPPLAWDDPDTLAWPDGACSVLEDTTATSSEVVDEVLVRRIVAGEHQLVLDATSAERTAVISLMRATGMALRPLERWGIKPERYRDQISA